MITLWQGSANQWDCDEMGHMNVRVYVEKIMEGLGTFAKAIDMPHAFRARTPSTLIPVDQHIRFIARSYATVMAVRLLRSAHALSMPRLKQARPLRGAIKHVPALKG